MCCLNNLCKLLPFCQELSYLYIGIILTIFSFNNILIFCASVNLFILTYFACIANEKKNVLQQTTINSFESAWTVHSIWRQLLLQNYVRRGVRWCNVSFTLERRYKNIQLYATPSNYWRDFVSTMEESRKKLSNSNKLPSFIVC